MKDADFDRLLARLGTNSDMTNAMAVCCVVMAIITWLVAGAVLLWWVA